MKALAAGANCLYQDFGLEYSDTDFLITQCTARYSQQSRQAERIGIQRSRSQ